MNEKERDIILNGDIGQGENLVEAKMKQQLMKNSNYGKEKRSASKASSKNSGSTSPPYVIFCDYSEERRKEVQILTKLIACPKTKYRLQTQINTSHHIY